MRASAFAVSFLLLPGLAVAQDRGVALNMGRGLDNGLSVNWTFRDDWTVRPTIGAGYNQQAGFQAAVGATVLRSFGTGHRVYEYLGAGVHYGSANSGDAALGAPGGVRGIPTSPSLSQNAGSILYFTAPFGLRARLYRNFEGFAEAAYQRTLVGQFGLNQTGQFTGNGTERVGATLGISLRL